MSDLGREDIGGQTAGSTLLEEQIQNVEPGDHERNSHYVRKEKIVESAVLGTPVIALCGKVWVPGRDQKNFQFAQPAKTSTKACARKIQRAQTQTSRSRSVD